MVRYLVATVNNVSVLIGVAAVTVATGAVLVPFRTVTGGGVLVVVLVTMAARKIA